MNAKELYQAIGEIDDDLILEAAEKTQAEHTAADTGHTAANKVRKIKSISVRLLATAAVFVALAAGMWVYFSKKTIIWNQAVVGIASKTSVPGECTARQLTKEEAAEYYGMVLQDTLLVNQKNASLTLSGQSIWVYENAEGEIVFDSSMIHYEDSSQIRTVNIALSKAIPLTDEENAKSLKASRINGTKVILIVDKQAEGVLGAQWEQDGTSIRIRAESIEKNELIQIVKELMAQKESVKKETVKTEQKE